VIARHRDEFEVRLMCRMLEVTPSGFYAYLRRPPSWCAVLDELLMAHVRIAFAESGGMYGSPRVLRDLREAGLPTSKKRAAPLMRQDGLAARPKRPARVVTTDSNHADPIAPNLVGRQFDVNGVGINRVHQIGASPSHRVDNLIDVPRHH
jgi:putative transposase